MTTGPWSTHLNACEALNPPYHPAELDLMEALRAMLAVAGCSSWSILNTKSGLGCNPLSVLQTPITSMGASARVMEYCRPRMLLQLSSIPLHRSSQRFHIATIIRRQGRQLDCSRARGLVSLSMPQAQADRKSSTLSSRLTSLFSTETPTAKNHPPLSTPESASEPASRRRSLDESFVWDYAKAARTRPPSPDQQSRTAGGVASSSSRPSHPAKSFSISTPPNGSFGQSRVAPSPAVRNQSEHPALPVLRWLTGKPLSNGEGSSQPRLEPTQSNPPSPSTFAALDDALHDNPFFSRPATSSQTVDMPSRPEAARLPSAFHSSRPPNYLSSLARSALPTACISPLSPSSTYRTPYVDPFDDPFASSSDEVMSDLDLLYSPTPIPLALPHSPPAAHLTRSPPLLTTSPKRSSLDTLRSIHEKGKSIHTTAPPPQLFPPILPNAWKGWFTTDTATDKENMDPLLDETDKAADAQKQRERIRERCKCSNVLLIVAPTLKLRVQIARHEIL